jgi:aspartate/methionine/tyrosine aminotransferase
MRFHASARARAVQDPIVPVIAEAIRANPGTLSLGQGVVWWAPPEAALRAPQALDERSLLHRYQPVHGIDALVERIAGKLAAENGIVADSRSRIVVTAGGNMAFLNVVLAICDPGDEVILPLPWYFNQEMALALAGARAVGVPTDAQYQLDPDAIAAAITPRTRAVVTVSPNNPTGAVYSRDALAAVNALCERHGLYHVSDEAYEYFVHEGEPAFSPASLPGSAPHTISLYSLSKAYGMASWRVGYMVVPTGLYPAIAKIQDTNLICPPVPSQLAAVAALEAGHAWCAPRIASLSAARLQTREALAALAPRVTLADARGAFYWLLSIDGGGDSLALAMRLIERHRVAVLPGSAFGATRGCLLRVSYGALGREDVLAGVSRLVEGLRARA